MKAPPKTRFYQMRAHDNFGWARIWVTDDGWISIMSDYGNYGHIFDAPGCEFRRFLSNAYEGYITDKLAYGSREVIRAEESVARVRKRICEWRRENILTRERAREEWELIDRYQDLEDPCNQVHWYEETTFNEPYDLFVYERAALPRIREFMKQCWPIFVAQLNAERAKENLELVEALYEFFTYEMFDDPEVKAFIEW